MYVLSVHMYIYSVLHMCARVFSGNLVSCLDSKHMIYPIPKDGAIYIPNLVIFRSNESRCSPCPNRPSDNLIILITLDDMNS